MVTQRCCTSCISPLRLLGAGFFLFVFWRRSPRRFLQEGRGDLALRNATEPLSHQCNSRLPGLRFYMQYATSCVAAAWVQKSGISNRWTRTIHPLFSLSPWLGRRGSLRCLPPSLTGGLLAYSLTAGNPSTPIGCTSLSLFASSTLSLSVHPSQVFSLVEFLN